MLRSEASETPEGFEPRYVEVPRRRRAQVAAERNLKWGLALLLLAAGLIGAALIISGPRALLPIVVCLVTLTILWALARLHVFHQRNGVFFATAVVCLLGAAIPLIDRGYAELHRLVHAGGNAPVLVAVPAAAPSAELSAEPTTDAAPRSLVEALKIKPPAHATSEIARVVEDTTVTVGRKSYLLRVGDTFALEAINGGQATIVANELRLSIPERAIEVVSAQPDTMPIVKATQPGNAPRPSAGPRVSDQELPADITARAKGEAMRRYPGIGVAESPENVLFVKRVQELRTERPEFFDEPEWPLYLAEALAQEQGWDRAIKPPPTTDQAPATSDLPVE